jgi:hypothetical protein
MPQQGMEGSKPAPPPQRGLACPATLLAGGQPQRRLAPAWENSRRDRRLCTTQYHDPQFPSSCTLAPSSSLLSQLHLRVRTIRVRPELFPIRSRRVVWTFIRCARDKSEEIQVSGDCLSPVLPLSAPGLPGKMGSRPSHTDTTRLGL